MKTILTLLFVVVGMITAETHAQVTVTGSIQTNIETVSEINYNEGIYTSIDRSVYNDLVVGFDQTTQILEKSFGSMPGSDEFGTYVECASGNFVVVRDYYTDAFGYYGYGLYHRDPDTGLWTRIRSYGKVSAGFSILSIGEEAIVTIYADEVSELGNTLVGDTYGGLRGEDGSGFIDLTESSTVIHRLNSSGAILVSEIMDHEVASGAVGIFPTASGILVKMQELVSEDFFYQLVNPETLVRIWETEIYEGAINLTAEEMDNGNFIFGANFSDSDSDFLVQYDGELLNPKIADDLEYPYGVASYPAIFANDTLCVVATASGVACSGSQELDLRYFLHNPEFAGYTGFTVDSVDFENMRAHVRVFYTGAGNTLAGTSLLDIEDGKTGVAFATIDVLHSGETIRLDESKPDVIEVFDNYERESAESNEMIATTKHVSAMQVTDDFMAGITPGATVDSDLYDGPGGTYTDYETTWQIDAETGDTFFVVATGKDDFTEAIYYKVIATSDDLNIPFVNSKPVILGAVDGVLYGGSIHAESNHEFNINIEDIDGHEQTLFIEEGFDAEVDTYNVGATNSIFVNVDYEIMAFSFDIWSFDGYENSDTVTFVTDIEGYLNILNNQEAEEIQVYPTLVVDYVNVSGAFEEVQIYSLTGALVKTSSLNEIDFTDLPSGRYVLRVLVDGVPCTKHIVKQ